MPQPLMPKATAVWLLDNTVLTFQQIAEFCNLHLLEVRVLLTVMLQRNKRSRSNCCWSINKSRNRKLSRGSWKKTNWYRKEENLPKAERRVGKKYTPLSKRQDRPDAIFWLVRNHPELLDAQISRLIGTTKNTIQSIRDRTHWNSAYLNPVDPVSIGLCTQIDLDKEVQKASKRVENRKKKEEKEKLDSTTLAEVEESNSHFEANSKNKMVQENNINTEVKNILDNNETKKIIESNTDNTNEKKEEYDSDSVFAKLQELKKD